MNLCDQLIEELGAEIVAGALGPGATLPSPAELGRRFGISRPIIREAIKALSAKGLVESRTRIGTRVTDPSRWNLLDRDVLGWSFRSMPTLQFFRALFEVRQAIEPMAAELAARKATAAQIAAIGGALAAMERADDTRDEAIEADVAFHQAILNACHNDLLLRMGSLLGVGLMTSFRFSNRSYRISMPLHRPVYEAIRARRPAKAREAMLVLLARTLGFIEGRLVGEKARHRGAHGAEATDADAHQGKQLRR